MALKAESAERTLQRLSFKTIIMNPQSFLYYPFFFFFFSTIAKNVHPYIKSEVADYFFPLEA